MPSQPLGTYGDEGAILSYWWYDLDRSEELDFAVREEVCLPDVAK